MKTRLSTLWQVLFLSTFYPVISSCTHVAPSCPSPMTPSGPAPSAGCVAIQQGKLLVVQGFNGEISIPGGSSADHEPARCTAHRETWEETGLHVIPKELIRQFDNGFHLYRCEVDPVTEKLNPPFRLEIQHAFWLDPENFSNYNWRFKEQQAWLAKLLTQYSAQKDTAQ